MGDANSVQPTCVLYEFTALQSFFLCFGQRLAEVGYVRQRVLHERWRACTVDTTHRYVCNISMSTSNVRLGVVGVPRLDVLGAVAMDDAVRDLMDRHGRT